MVLGKGFFYWRGYRAVLGGIVLDSAIANKSLLPLGGKKRAAMRFFMIRLVRGGSLSLYWKRDFGDKRKVFVSQLSIGTVQLK